MVGGVQGLTLRLFPAIILCPSPRPESLATFSPAAATRGATIKDTLSPTPPVECLSTILPLIPSNETVCPDVAMARVSAVASPSSMPRRYTAIAQAAIW